jgi:hypothetical protein
VAAAVALGGLSCTPREPVVEGFIRSRVNRDVWLSAVDEERNFNMGAARRIKLKVWQEFGLVDFDVAALEGKTIRRVFLYVRPAGGHRLGLNGGTDLRWLTVSTISHDWVEGDSKRPGLDRRGHGATFRESSFERVDWGFESAKVWDVILGNGNSLRFDGRLEPAGSQKDGWLRIELDPRLVSSLVSGASHGLALFDGSTDFNVNCFIKSRESGEGPFLDVEVGREDAEPPPPPTDLRVRPAPSWAAPTLGAAEIGLRVPRDAFSFDVHLNGQPLERWQIPFAGSADELQSFPIVDLAPDSDITVELAAVDTAGNRSELVTARGRASPPLTVPLLPDYPFRARGGEPPRLGNARVWAFPEVTKVDPISGETMGETGSSDLRRNNAVWDAASRRIRLAAARGEIISFQVAVEGEVSNGRIEVSQLEGPGRIDPGGVRIWRNWYVGRQAEYALPWTGTFDVPSADNRVPGQTLQAVTVDLHIPSETPPGDYLGSVTVEAGGRSVELDLAVRVYDVVLPDNIHFNVELNAYQGPGQAGSRRFIDSFRLAHYHRATINRVPYFQDGSVHEDWIPDIGKGGKVTDWQRFDTNLGGLLDGTWFRDNPRSGVPVPVLYLPFFEGWPKDYRRHYHPGQRVPINGGDPISKLRHDVLAKPIQEAFDQIFKDAMAMTLGDFVRHFQEKEWNRTLFQFYLNNKPRYGYTLWTLDEPFEYLDWAALNFFARLVKQVVDDPEVYTPAWHRELGRTGLAGMNRSRPTILFRGDVSRPMWQGSVSDGLMNTMYVSTVGFDMPRLLRSAKHRMPALLYTYGSANEVGESNWQSVAWCLNAYVHYFDGVLPWQSLGGVGSMEKPTTTALLIDAGRYGHAVASLRLHALRRGAQDCELLRLLQVQRGWSREQIGLLIAQKISLVPEAQQENPAAHETPRPLTARGFLELKEGLLQLLDS